MEASIIMLLTVCTVQQAEPHTKIDTRRRNIVSEFLGTTTTTEDDSPSLTRAGIIIKVLMAEEEPQ